MQFMPGSSMEVFTLIDGLNECWNDTPKTVPITPSAARPKQQVLQKLEVVSPGAEIQTERKLLVRTSFERGAQRNHAGCSLSPPFSPSLVTLLGQVLRCQWASEAGWVVRWSQLSGIHRRTEEARRRGWTPYSHGEGWGPVATFFDEQKYVPGDNEIYLLMSFITRCGNLLERSLQRCDFSVSSKYFSFVWMHFAAMIFKWNVHIMSK